jgi:HlyD family secretion protein
MLAQASQVKAAFDKQIDYYKKSKIRAPMTGVISYLDCEVGEIAAAQTAYSQGKTLMTISDLSVFEVEVEVDETEINKVELAQKAKIEVDAIPDSTFQGAVVEIGNTAITSAYSSSDQTTNFKVKVTFLDPSAKLRPGMSATVDITTAQVDSVPAVPFSSVVTRQYNMDSVLAARVTAEASSGSVHAAEGEESAGAASGSAADEKKDLKGVFILRNGRALFSQVTTGVADRKDIQVTSGLQAGDSVISGPYRLLRTLKDNDVVKVIEKPKTGEPGQEG